MVGPIAKAAGVGFAVLIVLSVVTVPFYTHTTPEGHVGVEKKWTAVTGSNYDPGFHFVTPIKDSVQDVPIRPRTYTMSNTEDEGQKTRGDAVIVQTVNGTSVAVDVTVRYRVDRNQTDEFVREWNNVGQMEHRLIRPTVKSRVQDEASNIETSVIYTSQGRESLESAAREALGNELADEPVVLEAVQVREVDLPQKIDSVLDNKEQAKQRVLVEQERIQQERKKAEQKEIRAQADAEVIRIRGQALQNNSIVLNDRYINALDEGTVFVVPQNGSTPIMLSEGGQQAAAP